jgi:hypothetical protein
VKYAVDILFPNGGSFRYVECDSYAEALKAVASVKGELVGPEGKANHWIVKSDADLYVVACIVSLRED